MGREVYLERVWGPFPYTSPNVSLHLAVVSFIISFNEPVNVFPCAP